MYRRCKGYVLLSRRGFAARLRGRRLRVGSSDSGGDGRCDALQWGTRRRGRGAGADTLVRRASAGDSRYAPLRNEAQSIKLDAGKFIAQDGTKRGREPRNRDGQRFWGGGPAWAGADGTFTLTLGGSGCFQLRKLGSKRRPARRCFEGWFNLDVKINSYPT